MKGSNRVRDENGGRELVSDDPMNDGRLNDGWLNIWHSSLMAQRSQLRRICRRMIGRRWRACVTGNRISKGLHEKLMWTSG
jgi:hypothetical protein